MNYKKAQEYIDDYVDGLLDPERAKAFEAYLATCERTQADVEAVRELKRAAKALPASILPERDLWSGIESRIERGGRLIDFGRFKGRRRYPVLRYALAAAALVLMILGAAVLFQIDESAYAPASPVAADPELDRIERQYLEAKAELLAALQARQNSLSPETLAIVEENLAIIETAVTDIHVAIVDYPDSPGLERMLHAAYQSQVDLLQQAVQLADES